MDQAKHARSGWVRRGDHSVFTGHVVLPDGSKEIVGEEESLQEFLGVAHIVISSRLVSSALARYDEHKALESNTVTLRKKLETSAKPLSKEEIAKFLNLPPDLAYRPIVSHLLRFNRTSIPRSWTKDYAQEIYDHFEGMSYDGWALRIWDDHRIVIDVMYDDNESYEEEIRWTNLPRDKYWDFIDNDQE